MPNTKFIQRMVNLKPRDLDTVWRYAEEHDFGGKGFSRALRCIIREWETIKEQQQIEECNLFKAGENIDFSHPPFP